MKKTLSKNKVYLFLNSKYGGVYSVVKNIITYSQLEFNYNIIILINKNITPDFVSLDYLDKGKQHVFIYTPSDNFYTTCKRLANLIPDEKSILVANDWVELGMVSLLGMNNPVVQILHGNYEYYFELARKHNDSVNYFVAVSESIAEKVKVGLDVKCSKVAHIPFPVKMGVINLNQNRELRILFVAADLKCPNKKFHFVKEINTKLEEKGVNVIWNIVGGGYTQAEISQWWGETKNPLIYHGFLSAELLPSIFKKSNLYILPSKNEGLPVSLIEAMGHGLVPIINLWEEKQLSLVKSGYNGYVVENGNSAEYINILCALNNNISIISELGKNAFTTVIGKFNPYKQATAYENLFIQAFNAKNSRQPKKVYGSRLDQPWIPNFITKNYRRLFAN
jgi:glycosyltransferase involved in cell wall biosynthesis